MEYVTDVCMTCKNQIPARKVKYVTDVCTTCKIKYQPGECST